MLPILREHDLVGGAMGRYFVAAGAIGELFPILAIAIFLGVDSRLTALVSILAICLIAVALAAFRHLLAGGRLHAIVSRGADSTGQTTLRFSILLLLVLLVLAGEFGLDVVLGAFLAGAVLRRWAPGDTHSLEGKLDAVGYGFFIPVFFVGVRHEHRRRFHRRSARPGCSSSSSCCSRSGDCRCWPSTGRRWRSGSARS